eukprot:g1832.t1
MSGKIKSYSWEHPAYALAVYHSLRNSGSTCCGFLLGRAEGKDGMKFHESVPFSHTHALSPTLKMACHATEVYAQSKDLEICGLYVANELLPKTKELYPIYRNIFERFTQNNNQSTVWILDGARLEEEAFAFRGFTASSRNGRPHMRELVQIPEASVKASCGSGLLEKTQSLQYFDVADFDDHLHDPEKDWTNAELNGKLALAKAAGA